MPSGRSRLPLVDVLKALASQFIVWHHFAFYGPMSDVVHPYAPALLDWLYRYARVAVQVFLVVGGFLAARSLSAAQPAMRDLPRLLWRRYLRLGRPYWIAVAAAALSAGVLPSLVQALAHAVFLQDILRQQSLSAGVWYVAIDFQLFVVLALLVTLPGRYRLPATLVLGCLSLFWLNRNPDLDIYAPYFFGSYSLGVFAEWIARRPRRIPWLLSMTLLIAAALLIEYRVRIFVAGLTALLLAATAAQAPAWTAPRPVRFLSRISYAVFLIHYPVYVLVGRQVSGFWPAHPAANALGLMAAWALSLFAGWALNRWAESAPKTPTSGRTASAAPDTCS